MKFLNDKEYKRIIDRLNSLEDGYSKLREDSVITVYEESEYPIPYPYRRNKTEAKLRDLMTSVLSRLDMKLRYVPEVKSGYTVDMPTVTPPQKPKR